MRPLRIILQCAVAKLTVPGYTSTADDAPWRLADARIGGYRLRPLTNDRLPESGRHRTLD